MIFKLKVLQNNIEKIWHFDNITGALYDENNNQLNAPATSPSNHKLITRDYYEQSPIDVQNLVIFVGSKCNYNCKYCPEIKFRNQSHDANPNDVERFKKLVSKNLDMSKIRLLAFSGGEPLVYWKTIRELITFFNENCPNLVNFRFITNGALLTGEIVQECIEKGIRVVVSDDGGDNRYRKQRTEQQRIDSYTKYNRYADRLQNDFVIRYQLGRHHLDAIKMYQYFKRNIPNIKCIADQGVIEAVMPDNDASETMIQINTLTNDQLKLLSDSRYQLLLQRKPELQNTTRRLNAFIKQLKTGTYYAQPYRCHMMYMQEMYLDLAGNILKCMWIPTKDNVAGHLSNIKDAKFYGYKSWTSRDNCWKCPLVAMCESVCPLATNATVNSSCKLMYADMLAYFKAALKTIWNVDVLGFEPNESSVDLPSCVKVFNNYKSDYQKISQKVNWELT